MNTPSAVNIAKLPAPFLPSGGAEMGKQLGQAIGMMGKKIQNNRNDKKVDQYREELLAEPEAAEPTTEEKQAQLQTAQVELQKEQQIEQATSQADQNKKNIDENATLQRILGDTESLKKLSFINKHDPESAKMILDVAKTRDISAKAALAQQASEARSFYETTANLFETHGEDTAKQFMREKGKELSAMGVPQETLNKITGLLVQSGDGFAQGLAVQGGIAGYTAELPELMSAKDQLDREKFEYEKKQDALEAAGGGVADFSEVQSLRKEFAAETKPFMAINDAYGRVLASAEDPSPAGDMALIFNYMKVLDPGSTVREGEFATAQNAGSVPQGIVARYNKVINGEMLETNQRKDFVNRAGKLYKRAEKNYNKRVETFRELARKRNFDPDEVIIDRAVEGGVDNSALIAEAEAAIAAGADREQVMARLAEMGVK